MSPVLSRRCVLGRLACVASAGLTACSSSKGPVEPTRWEIVLPLMEIGLTLPAESERDGRYVFLAVTRLTADRVVAVSRECTHQGCTIALPQTPGATLNCPCHGSRFAVTGEVTNGPADRTLRTWPAVIVQETVVIRLD